MFPCGPPEKSAFVVVAVGKCVEKVGETEFGKFREEFDLKDARRPRLPGARAALAAPHQR